MTIEPGVFAQSRDLPGQPIREADIVGIHPRDELAATKPDRLLSRAANTVVFFTHQANAWIIEAGDDGATLGRMSRCR